MTTTLQEAYDRLGQMIDAAEQFLRSMKVSREVFVECDDGSHIAWAKHGSGWRLCHVDDFESKPLRDSATCIRIAAVPYIKLLKSNMELAQKDLIPKLLAAADDIDDMLNEWHGGGVRGF